MRTFFHQKFFQFKLNHRIYMIHSLFARWTNSSFVLHDIVILKLLYVGLLPLTYIIRKTIAPLTVLSPVSNSINMFSKLISSDFFQWKCTDKFWFMLVFTCLIPGNELYSNQLLEVWRNLQVQLLTHWCS